MLWVWILTSFWARSTAMHSMTLGRTRLSMARIRAALGRRDQVESSFQAQETPCVASTGSFSIVGLMASATMMPWYAVQQNTTAFLNRAQRHFNDVVRTTRRSEATHNTTPATTTTEQTFCMFRHANTRQ